MSEQSSAAKYRAIRNSRRAKIETVSVKSPSGMVWQLRRVPFQLFISNGVLPLSIVEKLSKAMSKAMAKGGGVSPETLPNLDESEALKMIGFIQKLIKEICVSPRIVANPQAEDEIAPEELLEEDFNFLVKWGMSGGSDADALDGFRLRPGQDALVGADGKKRRRARKQSA
jgi:hypothetical protein